MRGGFLNKIKSVVSSIHKFLRDKWERLKKTCIGKFRQKPGKTILFFVLLGLGIGCLVVAWVLSESKTTPSSEEQQMSIVVAWVLSKLKTMLSLEEQQMSTVVAWVLSHSKTIVPICQKILSLLASVLFIFLMFKYRLHKLKKPIKLQDEASFFNYFSPRSYISRHKLKIPNKAYFELWRNHYPYSQYKSEVEFSNAQHEKEKTGKDDYINRLRKKLIRRIKKNAKSFIWNCIWFAAAYALYCLYGICCLSAECNKETKAHEDNIIGTTQEVIFKYKSSLLEDGQEMEIKVPATMLKYNYEGKHFHANNIQAVHDSTNRDTTLYPTIINPCKLQFYIDKDSLRYLNKTNEYPELNDLEYMLKYKNDSISISIIVSVKDTLTLSNQTLINLKEQYYSQNRTTIFKRFKIELKLTKTWQNTINLLFDLLTTILLLLSYNNLSNTTTREHKQHKSWGIIVLLTFWTILLLLDIYVAKMLVEDKYIFAHWIIASITSLFAAMTIASFASRMYPQYQENNLTKNKIFDVFVFAMIYIYACVNILVPFVTGEIIDKDLELINKINSMLIFMGISSLYFVMFRFSRREKMNMFFIHEINNLRTMEKENIGFKELHLLMQNKDRKEELLSKDKTDEKDGLDLLVEMKEREKKLSKLLKK